MKARVEAIESKSSFKDGQRRLIFRFAGSSGLYDTLRLPENILGIVGLSLDDEVEVSFHPVREQAKSEAA